MKDLEKSVLGNQDAYSSLKTKLENLPDKVIVMGSHTQIDNRKEKVIHWQIFLYLYWYICYLVLKSFSITWLYIYIFYDLLCYSPMLVVFYLRSLAATTLHYLILHFRYAKCCHNGYDFFLSILCLCFHKHYGWYAIILSLPLLRGMCAYRDKILLN